MTKLLSVIRGHRGQCLAPLGQATIWLRSSIKKGSLSSREWLKKKGAETGLQSALLQLFKVGGPTSLISLEDNGA